MAAFRVEKNHNYTVMANYHLKDNRLSLKAKGLMSVMLSLPDDWDYTLRGLACICKEGVDAIREAIREMERAGFILRTRERNGIRVFPELVCSELAFAVIQASCQEMMHLTVEILIVIGILVVEHMGGTAIRTHRGHAGRVDIHRTGAVFTFHILHNSHLIGQ